MNLPSESAGI